MNFDFYIFGTPNNSYNQFLLDDKDTLFREFAQNQKSDGQLIVYRKSPLIYYTYLRSDLLSKAHNEGAYLGMSMVFNSVCFYDVKGIFELFDKLFFSMISKGEIIKRDKSGKIAFTVDKFIKKQAAIEECRASLQRSFENQFNQINRDFAVLDTSFNQTNLAIKTLSLNGENSDILDSVRKYRYLVLTSQNVVVPEPVKFKWKKLAYSLIVIAIMGVSIILVMRNINSQTPVVVKNYEVNLHDGSTYQYSGEIKDDMPNGKGKAKYSDNSIYEGNFKNGLRHGDGIMIFPDGYTYTGNYVQDKAEGQGEKHYPIAGKYLCIIQYPKKERFKIEISINSITNKYYGRFINYEYTDTLFASEFVINIMRDYTQISNAVLGEGSIIRNTNGEIEIRSTPKNEKKWNMRKIQ